MNDWAIKKFLKVVLAIQLAMWSVIGLDAIGLQIPILRQIIGFIYLTFVPGVLILRILKLHKLDNVETLLYSIGLSIAILMFTGLFMNTVYPLFGISGPISIVAVIITISILVVFLCVLSYVRDKDFSNSRYVDTKEVLSPPALFLCLIPFLAILGTYLVNFHHNNILLMFLIIVIALIVILIAFDKFIPKNLYPLAVFIIAISLLYHRSLISMYLWGSDIHIEYYISNLVIANSLWDSTIPSIVNTMLSIVMLAPIFSNICGMTLTWVFKIIYPLLFSLVPLGLYHVFQKQTDEKIAFLSCFFFVSLFIFYGEMLTLARQQIAELFLVLLILPMIDKDMNKTKRSFLFIVFGISLAVSHYGLSYIYLFCLISAWLILVLTDSPAIQKLKDDFFAKFSRYNSEKLSGNPVSTNVENRTISSTFVLLIIIFTLTWYVYVSASSAFNAIVHIGDHIASSVFTDFLNPEVVQGAELMTQKTVSPLHSVAKYLHHTTQFFIVVGFITLMLKRRDMKFEKEYEGLSLMSIVILFAALVVPYFASSLNTSRLYQITVIFLAPFCVVGGITVFKVFNKVVRAFWPDQRVRSSLKVLSVFFVIFLLFNSGLVYTVAKDHPGSISISQEEIKKYGDTEDKVMFYHNYIIDQDFFGAKWFSKNAIDNRKIYSDVVTVNFLISYGGTGFKEHYLLSNTTKDIKTGAYLFMGYANVIYGKCVSATFEKSKPSFIYNITEIEGLIKKNSKIYSNGGCNIYVNS